MVYSKVGNSTYLPTYLPTYIMLNNSSPAIRVRYPEDKYGLNSSRAYKGSVIVNYYSRVILTSKLPFMVTLEL